MAADAGQTGDHIRRSRRCVRVVQQASYGSRTPLPVGIEGGIALQAVGQAEQGGAAVVDERLGRERVVGQFWPQRETQEVARPSLLFVS